MITILGRPISKKNSKRVFMRGRYPVVISSEAYTKFERSALEQLKKTKEKHNRDVDVVYLLYYKGKLFTDADNAIAGLNDILQKSGIIKDDKQIKSGTFRVITGEKDWKSEIDINDL